jgi:hypothetical protein
MEIHIVQGNCLRAERGRAGGTGYRVQRETDGMRTDRQTDGMRTD